MAGGRVVFGENLQSIYRYRAKESPQALAIIDGARHTTYAELDHSSDLIAAELRYRGVSDGILVGVLLDTNTDLIAAMLGVIKAGGAYVPIDPSYPLDRQQLLIQRSGTQIVVGDSSSLPSISTDTVELLDIQAAVNSSHSQLPFHPEDLVPPSSQAAYVIFTSGTEGGPKGVLVEHRNVIALIEATTSVFSLAAQDRWTMFHSASFDFSVWEIWGPLLTGATLVLVPSALKRSPSGLLAFLELHKITIFSQTPSIFRILTTALTEERLNLSSLRLIVLGGEALYPINLRRWFDRYGYDSPKVVNMYGITECTVHATHKTIGPEDMQGLTSPIGRPLPGVVIRLLDTQGNPVPTGQAGEMYISGWGLARGYLNQPELTARRYLSVPGVDWTYRSGDIAVELPSGELLYHGRNDRQEKIRGYRIELVEIEQCLAKHPEVDHASVVKVVFGDDDHRLAAFIVRRKSKDDYGVVEEPTESDLRRLMEKHLPSHMWPNAYHFRNALPVTHNGKLDRDALETFARTFPSHVDTQSETEPQGEIERSIAPIWSELTKVRNLDRFVDFFDVGGSSLSALRLITQLNAQFGISIDLNTLGGELSISSLAAYIESTLDTASADSLENK